MISREMAAALRQARTTAEEFRQWCAAHGLTSFETYPEASKWGFVRDFLRERGVNARPSMVAPSRPLPAQGSPATGRADRPRFITGADGVREELGLDAAANRHRARMEAAALLAEATRPKALWEICPRCSRSARCWEHAV